MSRTRNLSTGSLAEHFLHLAVPAGIGMLFTTLYNVVDVFFAGLIGTDAQAGLAISFQVFFIFITFGFGLSARLWQCRTKRRSPRNPADRRRPS